MKLVQKAMTCAAFGVTVSLALGASGGFDPANARNKSSKMEPPPPEKVKPSGDHAGNPTATEYGVDGQILQKPPRGGIANPGGQQSDPTTEKSVRAKDQKELVDLVEHLD